MNYGSLAETITKDMEEAIRLILNPEVDPEVRRLNLEILLRECGQKVYAVIYAMNAYDMEIEYTTGAGIDNDYYSIAKKLSDSVSVGGTDKAYDSFALWLQDTIHKAQYDAFSTAYESGKHPTVTRTEPGGVSKSTHRYESACDWCKRHTGTFIEPTKEVFRQHECCNGIIKTSGWRTRNGTWTGKGWKREV